MKALRLFGPYVSLYRGRLALAILAILAGVVFDVARPWPLKIIIDDVLKVSGTAHLTGVDRMLMTLARGSRSTLLTLGVGLILGIAILDAMTSYAQTYWVGSVGQRLTFALRRRLYVHVQRLSLSFHERQATGDLIARIMSDIEAIQAFVVSGLLTFISSGLTLVALVTIMLVLNWRLTLLGLSVAPVLFVVVCKFTDRIKQASRVARRREGGVTSVVQETLSSIRIVQAFSREEYEDERFARQNQASSTAQVRSLMLQAQLSPSVDVLAAVGTSILVFFGAREVLAGSFSLGSMLVFIAYLRALYSPMRQLAKLSTITGKAAASAERIQEILAEQPTIHDRPGGRRVASFRGHVEFDHVDFAYAAGHPVLHDISFSAAPGQIVALVGDSGAGKTSIVSLIPRFYDPTAGCVRIDGIDIRDVTLESLRSRISLVLQEPLLFHATIRENIAYGRPDATMDDIVEAARCAHVHHFVSRLPEGYDTVIGERGETISGGERQRIAIARAIVRKAPILILDEPTASLDARSERLALEALERLRTGRTTFVIAHRLSTVRSADLILVIQDGRIVEQGTHDALTTRGGVYRQLCDLQFGVSGSQVLSTTQRSLQGR